MRRSRVILLALSLVLATALLAACGSGEAKPTPGAAPTPTSGTSAKTSAPKAATATPAKQGDGTLKIKLNLLNPEKQQDQYSVFFAYTGSVKKGTALADAAFVGPYVMNAGDELVVNIEQDLKDMLYQSGSIMGPMYADLVVTRVEDTHIRNPLCTPVKLTFEDLTTSDLGNELTVDVTDSALNDLYPEDVFIVKTAPPQVQGGGGYPRISYMKDGSTKSGLEHGSAGPDFLVAFSVAEIKQLGVRDAELVVYDADNKPLSEPMPLTFDENGHCEQGPLVIVKTK
ncbi:MAG: hypothetical protein ACYC1C_15355 [Chloroflexota bacterium]